MQWPLSQDYNEAIQNPALSLDDAELRQGETRTNALGLPVPCSGSFADVYQIRGAARAWAVKCFTREISGLRERYIEISAHLHNARLPFMVAFKYLDRGIRVRGRWYPALKMDWVEGLTLNQFIKENLDRPQVLQRLGQLWVSVARMLRDAGLAHCDLQHGNVLLVPGSKTGSLAIKLVDYDGMFVPALAGQRPNELGHPAYQHPQRLSEGCFNSEVDRFPLLVIYCAIRALIVGGRSLWDRYDNGDNLLFREQDLRNPHVSDLFAELMRLRDPEVRNLVNCLSEARYKRLDQSPLLEELEIITRPASMPDPAPRLAVAPHAPAAADGTYSDAPEAVPSPPQSPWMFGDSSSAVSTQSMRSPAELNARKNAVRAKLWIAAGAALTILGLAVGSIYLVVRQLKPDKLPQAAHDMNLAQERDKEPVTSSALAKEGAASKATARPCISRHQEPVHKTGEPWVEGKPGNCRLCWLYMNDSRYRRLWGGGEFPDGVERELGVVKRMQNASTAIETVRERTGYHSGGAELTRLTPDARLFVTANSSGTLQVLRSCDAHSLFGMDTGMASSCIAIDPTSRFAAIGTASGPIAVWDLKDFTKRATLPGHGDVITAVVFSPDGKKLISAGSGYIVRLWDWATKQEVNRVNDHDHLLGAPRALAFSKDGRSYVIGYSQGKARVMSIDGNREIARFAGHSAAISSLAIAPDNRRVVSGSFDKTVRVWELSTGKELLVFDKHTAGINAVDVASHGLWALSAGEDKIVRLWELASGQEILSLAGHKGPVTSVGFFPDGLQVFASGPQEFHIWRLFGPANIRGSAQRIQYLSNMSEYDVSVAHGHFGKKGALGYNAPPRGGDWSRIHINGHESPNGVSMHAPSAVKYRLGKTARSFLAWTALTDSASGDKIPTPLTFQVSGDGKILWESSPVDGTGKVQECEVDVTRVDVLELRVVCPGPNTNAHAVWLEPRLLLAQQTLVEVRYLSDMAEYDVNVYNDRFAKKGALGYSAAGYSRIRVNNQDSPNGISMHGPATAKYKLGKVGHSFIASIALNDSVGGEIPSPVTFHVVGDGKLLWKSKPVYGARQVQECVADVTGIDVLELRVECPGGNINAQAVWLDPHILLK